ncbi:hypothetical protein FOTG_07110 [Fusarium oxysporum f. sp. vasinfectum 25433]|uniref:Uncharacterized protein n=1 Tax=Fusarium oxysporum f. sp. vasinfectum 25433 TaxID=1089449 RepID=X0LXX4_FUSOX|nr:hypothetical protein FOTG_07110 [Fusarium oxysporum f. sp. vasinfectum 25433]
MGFLGLGTITSWYHHQDVPKKGEVFGWFPGPNVPSAIDGCATLKPDWMIIETGW